MNHLYDEGIAWVLIPQVEDWNVLQAELRDCGVDAQRYEPSPVNVKAIREKTGLTQEDFALRYGLDTSTVRNWEQGRSQPDRAARTVLWTIALHPEAIEASLEESAGDETLAAFGG